MANEVKNALRGIGSTYDVKTQLIQRPTSDAPQVEAIEKFYKAMLDLHVTSDLQDAFTAMIASMLNRDFRKHGYLYHCNDKGQLDRNYFMSDGERNLVADMAGL